MVSSSFETSAQRAPAISMTFETTATTPRPHLMEIPWNDQNIKVEQTHAKSTMTDIAAMAGRPGMRANNDVGCVDRARALKDERARTPATEAHVAMRDPYVRLFWAPCRASKKIACSDESTAMNGIHPWTAVEGRFLISVYIIDMIRGPGAAAKESGTTLAPYRRQASARHARHVVAMVKAWSESDNVRNRCASIGFALIANEKTAVSVENAAIHITKLALNVRAAAIAAFVGAGTNVGAIKPTEPSETLAAIQVIATKGPATFSPPPLRTLVVVVFNDNARLVLNCASQDTAIVARKNTIFISASRDESREPPRLRAEGLELRAQS